MRLMAVYFFSDTSWVEFLCFRLLWWIQLVFLDSWVLNSYFPLATNCFTHRSKVSTVLHYNNGAILPTLFGIWTNLHLDISPFMKFAPADNSPFVVLQGRTILHPCVCAPGQISVHSLSVYRHFFKPKRIIIRWLYRHAKYKFIIDY